MYIMIYAFDNIVHPIVTSTFLNILFWGEPLEIYYGIHVYYRSIHTLISNVQLKPYSRCTFAITNTKYIQQRHILRGCSPH